MRRNEPRQRRELNTIILDPVKGWGVTYRENPPGEPLRYQGRLVHLCDLDAEGKLRAIEMPTKVIGELPEEFYQARHWPQLKAVFGVAKSTWEKIETKLWLPALGILALVVFMMFDELVKL